MAKAPRGSVSLSNLGTAGRVQLRGLAEYQAKLRQLGDNMVERGCVIALAPGANLMRDTARAFAPTLQKSDPRRRAGTLKNAIQAMRVGEGGRKTNLRRYGVQYVVGIRLLTARAIGAFKRRTGRGAKDNPDDPFYGTILEFGRLVRTRHPFLKPAFQSAADPAVRIAFSGLRDYTDAEIRRLAVR